MVEWLKMYVVISPNPTVLNIKRQDCTGNVLVF